MKNYVIIVGASDLVMPCYRIARKDMGLGIIALDYNLNAPGMQYADETLLVSTKDVKAAVQASILMSQKHNIKGVFTCGADVEITVAAIAHALHLPGIPFEVATRCNDKILMHKHLDELGFKDKAKYIIANDLHQTEEAVKEIGYPCIFKPLDNCASRGIQRIEKDDSIINAYNLAVSFNGSRKEILIEECLEGSKHTVEMITYEDKWHLLSIIDTHYISPRWPCETGLNTTQQGKETQKKIFEFAEKAARTIGIDFNAHKIDINIAEDGTIKLIELTARLSGGFHCQYASPLAFGSNDIRAALKLAIGQPLDMNDIKHKYEKGAAVQALFPSPGKIISINNIDQAKNSQGVEQIFVWKKVGDNVGPYRNSADRPAFIIASGETTEQAILNAKNGSDIVKITTQTA